MKRDENETLHWIMRWGWMRWKQNLAFNNDDDKKNCTENYLHKKNKWNVQETIYTKNK